ncbi:MAG: hypothetical protein ABMA64_05310 [Myxococcota bacterium]
MLNLLAACIAVQTSTLDPTLLPPETDTGGTKIDTGGSTTPTPPSTVSGCAAVTGTRAVWLIDRADPTKVVKPVQPPVSTEVTWDLSGPDALGRLYLLDQSKGEGLRILRSDDGGCSWQLTGRAPSEFIEQELYSSPASPRLYIRYSYELYVSEDGGVSFALVSNAAPRAPIRVLGGSPDRLWSYDQENVVYSPDGGTTWLLEQLLPIPGNGTSFDESDPPRAASGGEQVQVWNGATWDVLASGLLSYGMPMWEPGGALAVMVVAEVGGGKYLLRSEDGIAPLADVGWGPAPFEESIRLVAVDGGALSSAGYLYDPTGEIWKGAYVTARTVDGVSVRHDAEAFDEVRGLLFTDTAVVAALQVPLTEQPD